MSSLLVGSQKSNAVLAYDSSSGVFSIVRIPSTVSGVDLGCPAGIKVGSDTNIYVASARTNRILQYSADGSVVAIFADGAGIENPQGIAFSPAFDYLYVANQGRNNILRIPVTVSPTGGVALLAVTTPGSGYTSVPNVGFSGGGGSGAAATALLAATGLDTVTVGTAGSGYTAPPFVTAVGGGGSGATFLATLTGIPGGIASITTTNPGSDYTSAPTLSITGGGGSGATATVKLLPTSVESIVVTSPGSGYTSAPTVGFMGGGGSGAAATAILTMDTVVEIFAEGYGLAGPCGLAVDSSGNIYVASFLSNQVLKWNPDGSFNSVFVSSILSPADLAFCWEQLARFNIFRL